jgi:hypothetical protein
MRARALGALAVLAACGAGDSGAIDTPYCDPTISFSPAAPVAGTMSEVRAEAYVDPDVHGVRSYTWTVFRDGLSVPFEDARLDSSEIKFIAAQPGLYRVDLSLDVPGYTCRNTTGTVTAIEGDANRLVRLRITPSPSASVPLTETLLEVPQAGDYDLQTISLDPGTLVSGSVQGAGSGVPAYLRFNPTSAPDAAIEAFADASGAYTVRLTKVPHEVLVVPGLGFAPSRYSWSPGDSGAFTLLEGQTVSGIVRDPAGAPLAGAKVQVFAGDVPSTLATTEADGSYTLKLNALAYEYRVDVVPPPNTGLPRLEVIGPFDFVQPVDIHYAESLETQELGGMQLRRSGNPLANAKITVVGAVSTAGLIGTLNATGTIRLSATANASGTLPTMRVVRGTFSAVIAAAPMDLAVVPLDLSSTVPASLTAPAMQALALPVTDGTDPLDGARVELIPDGPLGLAGAPSIVLTTDAAGIANGQIASGGNYDLLVTDPLGRAGGRLETVVTPATLSSAFALPAPVYVTGQLKIVGNPNPLVGAAVQILCAQCTNLDRARPLAEGATDQSGGFTLTVAKPDAL